MLNFLRDFWNLLEEFVEHMNPQFIQNDNKTDANKTE
jgi:hypothetical protein